MGWFGRQTSGQPIFSKYVLKVRKIKLFLFRSWWSQIWVKYIVPVIFFFFVLFQMFLSNNFLLSHLDTTSMYVHTYNKWNAIWYTCRLAASGRNKSHVVIANKWQKWNSLWPELDLVLYVLTRFLNTIQAVVPIPHMYTVGYFETKNVQEEYVILLKFYNQAIIDDFVCITFFHQTIII